MRYLEVPILASACVFDLFEKTELSSNFVNLFQMSPNFCRWFSEVYRHARMIRLINSAENIHNFVEILHRLAAMFCMFEQNHRTLVYRCHKKMKCTSKHEMNVSNQPF